MDVYQGRVLGLRCCPPIGTRYGKYNVHKTTIYLPAELQRALTELARRTRRRPADLIRVAIQEFLHAQDQPLPRSLGAGEDHSLAARDSEVWLRDQWSGT